MNAVGFLRPTMAPAAPARRPPSDVCLDQGPRRGWLVGSAGAALTAVALGGAAAFAVARRRNRSNARSARSWAQPGASARQAQAETAARRLHQGAALLSSAVLADSAIEHYRGGYRNRAMFVAPAVAGLCLWASLHGSGHPSEPAALRSPAYAMGVAAGAAGTTFHVYNLAKRETGLNWENLFYGAPLGAPAAISMAGLFGLAARRVATGRIAVDRGGKGLAALASLGLLGTSAEVWLLHFRGAFQNPFMYVPVIVPPLSAASIVLQVRHPSRALERTTRALLVTTAGLGLAGAGFHAYGIHRNMGGWRNWSQMLLQGPPLPAPPSFTGMALAGLGALDLIGGKNR